MRTINKDISLKIDGQEVSFRLTKLDAFSGVALLRLLMRVEEKVSSPTLLDLVSSLSVSTLPSHLPEYKPSHPAKSYS